MKKNSKRTREIITLAVVFAGVLLISALAVYLIGGSRSTPTEEVARTADQTTPAPREPAERTSPTPTNETFIDRMFGTRSSETFPSSERWAENMGRLSLRLLLAAGLCAGLAFRPRKKILALKRNPYVSQTQILLAIVAAALMIIVGDNAARAFGIFAAVSLVRFRTNIRDPKEITVLLISLALGLASGVGRWDLALILVIFSLIVLWVLEWRESRDVFRSLVVKVATRNVASTQKVLRQIFQHHGFDSELRGLER